MPERANKRRRLSIRDKLEILKDVNAGFSYEEIKVRHKVSKGAISYVRQQKEELQKCVNENKNLDLVVVTSRLSNNSAEIDRRVFTWFQNMRGRNIKITHA